MGIIVAEMCTPGKLPFTFTIVSPVECLNKNDCLIKYCNYPVIKFFDGLYFDSLLTSGKFLQAVCWAICKPNCA